jgi:hypothetical protein
MLGLFAMRPDEGNGERLPGKLRSKLGSFQPPLQIFNPRGEDLAEVSSIQQLGGLFLECLDPDGSIIQNLKISREARDAFGNWRSSALAPSKDLTPAFCLPECAADLREREI